VSVRSSSPPDCLLKAFAVYLTGTGLRLPAEKGWMAKRYAGQKG
jgi:hypothetical protein